MQGARGLMQQRDLLVLLRRPPPLACRAAVADRRRKGRRRAAAAAAAAADSGGGSGEAPSSDTPRAPIPPRLEARLRQLAERRERIERARKRAVLSDALEERRRLRRAALDFAGAADAGDGPSSPSPSTSFPQRLGRLLRELSRPLPPRLLRPGRGAKDDEDDDDDDDGLAQVDGEPPAAVRRAERRRAARRRAERAAAAQSPAAALLAALSCAALLAQWWPLLRPLAAYTWHAGPLQAWPALQASLWTYPETPATALLQFSLGGGGVGVGGGSGGGGWWRPLSSGLLGSGLAGGALVARGLASSAWWIEACAPFGGGAGAALAAFALSSAGACLGGALLPLAMAAGAGASAGGGGGPAVALLAGPGAVVGMHVAWAMMALRLRRDWRRDRTRAPPLAGGALEARMAAAAEARRRTRRRAGGESGEDAAQPPAAATAVAGSQGGSGADVAGEQEEKDEELAAVEEESRRMFEAIVALERGAAPALGRLPEALLPPAATAGGVAIVALLALLSIAQPASNPLSLAGGALGGAVAAAFSAPLSRALGVAARAPLFLALASLRVGARAALSAAGMVLAFAAATVRAVVEAAQAVRGL